MPALMLAPTAISVNLLLCASRQIALQVGPPQLCKLTVKGVSKLDPSVQPVLPRGHHLEQWDTSGMNRFCM